MRSGGKDASPGDLSLLFHIVNTHTIEEEKLVKNILKLSSIH